MSKRRTRGITLSVATRLAWQRAAGHDLSLTIELSAAGALAVIEPAYGGRLHQLSVTINGAETPLLRSPADPALYGPAPLEGGCYPMAPWPNRIRDGAFGWAGQEFRVANGREHALHGLVCDRPWEVVARVGRVVEMACDLGERWPWPARVWQRIELGPNFLTMKTEVRAAREAFPAGCGWHPWFRRALAAGDDGEAVRISVPAGRRYVFDGQLPTGEVVAPEGLFALDGTPLAGRRLDDCYSGLAEPQVTLEWPQLRLTIAMDCAFPHVQVYTPPEAFCIEPQTCAPDAFNLAHVASGAAVAAPGRPVSMASRWTWEVLP